ncbi:uncharacterized protein LOC104891917 [Beta vulgaris subsp. vulgaris]|uniref:uncharacterized protein LOC104891917 n=1 Tax=Beta vulgaris subsp. vulgaris TaxID=3555 RepID=UPI00254824EA|nr:uncharacterized protein LOC104891917 [Beta vulgaris subsp. vulgaris]
MDMIKKSVEKQVDVLRPPLPEQAPWLIYTHGTSKKKQIQTFFTISDNNSYLKSIPILRGKSICGSCHGWLILRDSIDPKQFSLCNLVTEQSLLLPPLSSLPMSTLGDTELSTCTLTSPPCSEDCILFLFFTDQVFSCRPKSKDEDGTSISSSCSWVSQKIDIDGKRTGLYSAISHKGLIYCCALSPVHRILLLCMKVADDPSNTLTKFLQLEEPICTFRRATSNYYIVESCGHIYWVCPCSRYGQDLSINNVEIWELDMHSKKWVHVKCLGGRAFFVALNCSTWCWASNGLQENCVYLLVPSENDKIFYSYSLDEKSLTVFRPLPNLKTPYSTPVWFNAMPQHEHQRLLAVHDVQRSLEFTQIGSSIQPHENERRESECKPTKLPEDILWLISKHLHLFDYWNFRASSKVFHSAIPLVTQRRPHNLLPLFIFFKNDSGLCQVIDPTRDDSQYNILQVSSDPFTVDCSKDGWIVVCLRESIKFFNPFMKVKGDFPPIRNKYLMKLVESDFQPILLLQIV